MQERSVRVALAQMDCRLGEVPKNCRSILRLIRQAADHGCEVVVFPETADTGFNAAVIRRAASDSGGEPFRVLRQGAAECRIHVLCGVAERTEQGIYNALVAFGPDGRLLATYRKLHLITPTPFNEDLCFSAGDRLIVLDIGEMKWGLAICYDLRFPELFRRLALKGAEVMVVCAAWPSFRVAHWEILTRARAIENQAYLLAVDRVGTDGAIPFAGRSRIISPTGDLLAEGGPDAEKLIIGELFPGAVQSFRNEVPVFSARRPDLYGNLCGERPGCAGETAGT